MALKCSCHRKLYIYMKVKKGKNSFQWARKWCIFFCFSFSFNFSPCSVYLYYLPILFSIFSIAFKKKHHPHYRRRRRRRQKMNLVSQHDHQITHCWLFNIIGCIANFTYNFCFIQVSIYCSWTLSTIFFRCPLFKVFYSLSNFFFLSFFYTCIWKKRNFVSRLLFLSSVFFFFW